MKIRSNLKLGEVKKGVVTNVEIERLQRGDVAVEAKTELGTIDDGTLTDVKIGTMSSDGSDGHAEAAQADKPDKKRTATARISAVVNTRKQTGGQVIGAKIGNVKGDVTIENLNLSTQTIVQLGPEALKQIIGKMVAFQGLDQRSLQAVMSTTPTDKLSRQIRAVVAAQQNLAEGGAAVDTHTAYRLGMLAAYNRDYETALSYFRQATQADSENREAFAALSWLQQYRAMSALNAGDLETTATRLDEAREAALHTDPLSAHDLAQRGYVYKTLAQQAEARHQPAECDKYYDEAARLFEQAAKLAPCNASAQNGLGNIRHAKGDLDNAISAYRRAIELEPKYTAAWHDLALAFEDKMEAQPAARKKWWKQALSAWEEAYRLAPDDPGFSADVVLSIGQRLNWLREQKDK